MAQLSTAEENYLKAIFRLSEASEKAVSTNAIAGLMETRAASVTDMVKRLAEKELIRYEKYRGVRLTRSGLTTAKSLLRRHRLWEVFLVNKLGFPWDEVHEIAEQLEHIPSPLLTRKLDEFLNHPRTDPHGDPIPDEKGNIIYPSQTTVADLKEKEEGTVVGVRDSSPRFLQFLDKIKINLGTHMRVSGFFEYDNSRTVRINNKFETVLSEAVCRNLLVKLKKSK